MGIKQYFIDKNIEETRALEKQYKKGVSLSKVNTVLLILDEKTAFNQKEFKQLQNLMHLDSAHFSFLTYKEKETSFNEFRGVVFTPNSFNWKAKIVTKSLSVLLEETFDLLIDYSHIDTKIKALIVPKVKATFKVGCASEEGDFYDFTLAIDTGEISDFNKEMVRYFDILNIIH